MHASPYPHPPRPHLLMLDRFEAAMRLDVSTEEFDQIVAGFALYEARPCGQDGPTYYDADQLSDLRRDLEDVAWDMTDAYWGQKIDEMKAQGVTDFAEGERLLEGMDEPEWPPTWRWALGRLAEKGRLPLGLERWSRDASVAS